MAHKNRAARRANQIDKAKAAAKQEPISLEIQKARALENESQRLAAYPVPPKYRDHDEPLKKPIPLPSNARIRVPFFSAVLAESMKALVARNIVKHKTRIDQAIEHAKRQRRKKQKK